MMHTGEVNVGPKGHLIDARRAAICWRVDGFIQRLVLHLERRVVQTHHKAKPHLAEEDGVEVGSRWHRVLCEHGYWSFHRKIDEYGISKNCDM